jgi:hypothetical protein
MDNELLAAIRENIQVTKQLVAELKLANARHGRWSIEEEQLAFELYKQEVSLIEISRALYNEFNTERSAGAIDTRLRVMGAYTIKRAPKLDFPKLADKDSNRPVMDRIYDDVHGAPF